MTLGEFFQGEIKEQATGVGSRDFYRRASFCIDNCDRQGEGCYFHKEISPLDNSILAKFETRLECYIYLYKRYILFRKMLNLIKE